MLRLTLLAGALLFAFAAWATTRAPEVCAACYDAPCEIVEHCPPGCACVYGRCVP